MIEPLTSIQIYAPNGGAYIANPNAETQAEQTAFPVTNSCERSAKLMGDDYVRLVFKLSNKVIFEAFSYIEYGGQTFFLKERYIPTPNGCLKDANGVSSAYYSYDVKFVSVGNMLSKATCYRHVVVEGAGGGEWDEPEINLNGTLETMYVVVMGAISQYCKRVADGNCKHFYDLLCTIPANGLTKVGGVISPNTDKVKLTTGTELVSFSFQGDNIANVCTTIANSYTNDNKDTEWYITEDSSHSLILHFAKCEDTADNSIQQYSDYVMENAGADKMLKPYRSGGLTKVEYAQEWSGIAQTIVPYGSDRNMSGVWRKDTDAQTQMMVTFGKRLRLDPKHSVKVTLANGSGITYAGAYQVKDKDGNAVILRVNAQGGVTNPNVTTGIEQVKFYDDIYPQCHFRVTSVSVRNKRQDDETVPEYTIEAVPITSTKEQLVANGFYPLTIEEATTLSVRFESGLLNGREFEIANKTYKDKDTTTYSLKFTIVADGSIEDGTLIPSGNFIPHGDDTKGDGKGDEFALFNMKMPQQYVEYAQQELAQKAYDELVELQNSRPEVKCTTDPVNFDGEFHFGQLLGIKSELFGGTDNEFVSRVISYSYSLTTPNNVQFSLASAIMQGTLAEMNAAISNVTNVTGGLGQRAVNLSRRGWRDASEVSDMLNSITAEMMLVGNEKYQFAFTSAIKCVNDTTAGSDGVLHFEGLQITYGSLQHTQDPYIGYANKGLWEMPATTPLLTTDHNGEMLNADTPYYLYAVVADDSNPVVYELWGNNEESRAEDEAYLLLGILSSEFEDNGTSYRVFSRTNGYTAIEGGTITTEQIQDAGRNLIIDFQSNPPRIIARNGAEIIGNIRFKAGDTKTAEEQLRDLGIGVDDAKSTADSAKAAIDNLEIGGRNLAIFNTATVFTMRKGTDYDFTQTNADTRTQLYLNIDDYNGSNGSSFKSYVHNEIITKIGTYSYSFTLTADTSLLRIKHNGSKVDVISVFHFTEPLKAGTNLVLSLTFTNVTQGTFAWKNVKIEKGTVATDWTPAPEDVEASIAENKTYTDGLVKALGDNLQNQIDGVVDSYFLEGKPTNSNYPANEWKTDELKKRHEGDTYTDITKFVDDKTTPYAGHSWRWCKGTGDSPATTWHWHEIADSDAVRALQAAAEAQDTADGKRRVFVVEPTPPYDLGDLWAQGSGEGKDLLKCKTAKSAGQTFAQDDWESASSALAAAQAAQDSVDNMEIGGENLYTGDNPLTIAVRNSRLVNYKLCTNLQNSGKYIFSCENSTDSSGLIGSTYIVGLLNQDDENDLRDNVNIPFGNDFAKQVFTIPDTGNWSLVIRKFVMRQTLTWTNVMVQKGTKATSYQTALSFLGKAIKDMDTTVTGGLLMTGVMMLKDTDNKTVTAGMSGLTEYILDGETVAKKDNVLLWGGADYANAFVAANNADYAKKDGKPITTLIKKDGTGKIGVFRIGENSVRVVTDSSTIVITNESISDSIFLAQGSGTTYAAKYEGHSYGNGSNTTYAAFEQIGDYYVIEKVAIKGAGGKYRINVNNLVFSAKVSAQGGNTNGGGAYAYIFIGSLYLAVKDGGNIKILRTIYDGDLIDGLEAEDEGYSTSPYTQSFNKTVGLSFDSTIEMEHSNVQVCIVTNSANVYGHQNESNSLGQADLNLTCTMSVTGVEKYAVFAKDGMAIIANANSSFQIDNSSSDNLNIIAKGLPTASSGLSKGQLYSTSDGIVRIIKK